MQKKLIFCCAPFTIDAMLPFKGTLFWALVETMIRFAAVMMPHRLNSMNCCNET